MLHRLRLRAQLQLLRWTTRFLNWQLRKAHLPQMGERPVRQARVRPARLPRTARR